MDNQLMMFEGQHEVMILTKDDVNLEFHGEFLVCAKDVALVLEYARTEDVTKFCKDGQVVIVKNHHISSSALNRNRKLNNTGEAFITNLALNRVLGKSEKRKAEPLQDWLYEEVLPSVQKHGSYSTTNQQIAKVNRQGNYALKMVLQSARWQSSWEFLKQNLGNSRRVCLLLMQSCYLCPTLCISNYLG